MPGKSGKILRRLAASFLKRFYILVNDGYSVGQAYGARFLFDWRHSLDKKVALELYENRQVNYLLELSEKCKPEMFIDAGAHAALYSVVMKKRFPDIEVHAFEPDATNLGQLQANLFVNRLTHDLHVHRYGLSNTTGKSAFVTSEAMSSRGTRRIEQHGNIEIEVKRLDDVIQSSNKIIVLKIDVEGHECPVIEGAGNILGANRCILQIESAPARVEHLTTIMRSLGYSKIGICSNDHYFTNIESLLKEYFQA